jgi:hypothetical protein
MFESGVKSKVFFRICLTKRIEDDIEAAFYKTADRSRIDCPVKVVRGKCMVPFIGPPIGRVQRD